MVVLDPMEPYRTFSPGTVPMGGGLLRDTLHDVRSDDGVSEQGDGVVEMLSRESTLRVGMARGVTDDLML